jgi:hypothetical protein
VKYLSTAAALCVSMVAALSAQPALPDFSGTWQIDDARSGRGVDVWGARGCW